MDRSLSASEIQDEYSIGVYDEACQVPITIQSDSAGSLNITNLSVYYRGYGNYTWNATSNGTTITQQLYTAYSNFREQLPTRVLWWTVYPKSYNQTNVTPYGQNDTTPIWYINGSNYKTGFDLSLRLNETLSCINITASNTSTKGTNVLTTSYTKLVNNIGVYGNASIWEWVDLNMCNSTGLRFWNPTGYFDATCTGCI